MSFILNASQGARFLSGEYDYKNLSGESIYYADHQTVSTSDTEVAVGSTLSRRGPSWVISGGKSLIDQLEPQLPAGTAAVPPAGGTGATAGAYDTAPHRDELIASVTALVADVEALRQEVRRA